MNAMESLGWTIEEPTARGVATAVSRAIRDGTLKPGTKLPPVRSIAKELKLSPTTVSSAWSLLARSGAIHTDGRRGTRIADVHPGSARYKRTIDRRSLFSLDLSTGVPDPKLLPDLSPALKDLTSAATPTSYLDDHVLPELVGVLRKDWPYPADQFTMVDGAMDGLEMAIRTTVRFGDRVVVEHPNFPLLLDQLEAAGAEIVGVPVDDQGMLAEPLANALAKPASAVILQPRAQNPTGTSLSSSRAQQLANIIGAIDITIIEDDSAGAVAFTPAVSLGRWLPKQTIHIRSFSKSHGPDLRLAAMSGPSALIEEIISRRQLGQGWSSRILQQILFALLTDDDSIRQVTYARQEYHRRLNSIVAALESHEIPVNSADGLNIWIPVLDESAAVVRLASQGIGVAPGTPFSVLTKYPPHVRLTSGLVADSPEKLIDTIATAARTGRWNGGR